MSSSQNPGSLSIVRRYDLILFDLDGTLMDTSEGILSAVRYTIKSLKLHELPEDKIRSFIGPPIQQSFAKEYGVTKEVADRYASVFRERYKNFDLVKAVPYPGIYKTLKDLRSLGCVLAVATYKREDYAVKLLDGYGFLDYFDIVHGSDFSGKQKKSDIIRLCINEAQCKDSDKAVLIGDTDSDRFGAQEAGIHFLGVTYGFGYKAGERIEYADKIIHAPEEICCFVKQ